MPRTAPDGTASVSSWISSSNSDFAPFRARFSHPAHQASWKMGSVHFPTSGANPKTWRLRLAALALAATATAATAGDWLQFRGPNGSGVSTEKNLPSEWSADKNVAWKAKVPGVAWSSPIIVGDKVIVTTAVADGQPKPGGGFGGGGGGGTLFAVKAGATGDISPAAGETASDGVVWSVPRAMPSAASPLPDEGYVYTFDRNGGTASGFDAKTGKAEYTKERISNARAVWASPWAYGGQVFVLDESGATHVLKAGPEFEMLRTNALGRETYWSSPSVAGGNVFIRGVDSLTCIK